MKRLALGLLLALLPFAACAGALPATPYVQVAGHGSVTAVPDLARVTVSVAKTDKDLALARNAVEQRAAAVIAAARKLGIAERDINAASISIWPEYQWQNNSQVFAGQHVSRNMVITLRDLSRYADLVAALVKAGIMTFDTALDRSDLAALRRQALAQAVEDAHARALALARAAQVNLGAVYSITENNGFARPQPMMTEAKMSPADGAQYQPGSMQINADVSVVYLLQHAP